MGFSKRRAVKTFCYVAGAIHTARPVAIRDEDVTILKNNGNTSQALDLCCCRLKETWIQVSNLDGFLFSRQRVAVTRSESCDLVVAMLA